MASELFASYDLFCRHLPGSKLLLATADVIRERAVWSHEDLQLMLRTIAEVAEKDELEALARFARANGMRLER
jgi:hypothetical protein